MSIINYTSNKPTHTVTTNVENSQSKPFVLKKTVEESIVMSLLGLADAINKKADIHCQRFGITMNQYLILLYLAGDPNIEYFDENTTGRPIVASELADALNVSRPNITNLVNLLIMKNLVEQVKDKVDCRKKLLILTEDGWALLEKMQPRRYRINRRLLTHFSENDKKSFLVSLQTCLDLLNQKECP